MAWNQPGGNGGRDPWGDRGQQGPPDLDEILKKLQGQWSRFFGRKPGGPSGGGISLGGGGAVGLGLVLLVALGAWLLAGVTTIQQAEEGVVLRLGKFNRIMDPGFNWAPYFIDSVEPVNVREIRRVQIGFRTQGGAVGSVPHEALMLTEDENIVDLQFAVQYRVKDSPDFLFNVDDPITTLRQATESAVREIVGRSGMDDVITENREAVAAEARALIQDILDRYGTGLLVTSMNMQNAQAPAQVQDAFIDAIKAREDKDRIINEADAYKADIVPKARGESLAIKTRADGYRQRVIAQAEGEAARFINVLDEYAKAPEVTRERLYLETVESVLANSSKVLVDVKGGNNLLLMPLDKLLAGRAAADASTGALDSGGAPARSGGFDGSRRSRDDRGRRTR